MVAFPVKLHAAARSQAVSFNQLHQCDHEAKRRALDEIAARQCAADEKRLKDDAERREQAAVVSQAAVVQ
jgi:non-homologous end joining protein Ku